MNKHIRLLATSFIAVWCCATMTHAQTTTFTYQGRLTDGSTAASGTYDLQFTLFSVASGQGSLINAMIERTNVTVSNGVFTVQLDFGSSTFTSGSDRFLQIAVKRPGETAYTTLSPRQPLTATPYAIRTLSAETAATATSAATATNAQQLGGVAANQYVLTGDVRLSDARQPVAGSANYVQNTTSPQASANFNIAGNGTAGGTLSGNVVNATTEYKIGGFRILSAAGTSNTFTGFGAGGAYISGTDNSYFGRSAAGGSETGNHNSFFGANAGILNTTNDNSFFGSRAGFSTTTGGGNSFFGRSAGFANAEGADNSFFGRLAGANNTTGVGNTFLGTLTGAANVSGSNNTLIGTGANTTANNLTNATAIGAGATAVASNTVTLGRNVDTVRVPGALTVTGTLNASGASLTSLNASNITTGTLDNARLGVVPRANGGTGLSAVGASGNLLRSNGSAWTSAALTATDIPSGSANYIQNHSTRQTTSNFNISGDGTAGGTLSGNVVNATMQYNIGGDRVLSVESSNFPGNLFVGPVAGDKNTTGLGNVFVGPFAGNQNTKGHSNVFVGTLAGTFNDTGSKNTLVGDSANVGADDLTHATAIGASAIVNTSSTIALGRENGADKVVIYGLGAAGSTSLCRNSSNQIATCSSSLRYKTNIAPFSFGLNLVTRLQPITFDWRDGGLRDLGLGAEAVAAVEPLLVTYNQNGQVEGVKYDRLGVVLLNAVREQQTQIEQQQQQLAQQQILIGGLRKLVCAQKPQAEVCKEK